MNTIAKIYVWGAVFVALMTIETAKKECEPAHSKSACVLFVAAGAGIAWPYTAATMASTPLKGPATP